MSSTLHKMLASSFAFGAAVAALFSTGSYAKRSPDHGIPTQWKAAIPLAWDSAETRATFSPGQPMPETLTWTLDQIMDGKGYECLITMIKSVMVTDLEHSTSVWAGAATGRFHMQSESISRLSTNGSSTSGFAGCLTMITFPTGRSISKSWGGQHITSLCCQDLRMGQRSTLASRMSSLTSRHATRDARDICMSTEATPSVLAAGTTGIIRSLP